MGIVSIFSIFLINLFKGKWIALEFAKNHKCKIVIIDIRDDLEI